MSASLFVSFVYEDKLHFDRVKQWAEDGKLGSGLVITGETKDVRQGGDAAIREHIKPRVEGSSAVLLLLGSSTHNHEWVKYELSVAVSFHKRVIVARIPGTSGAAPEGFRNLGEIALDPSAIKAALA
jgi:hypothetical protein